LVSTLIKDPIEESIGFFMALLYYPLKYIMKFLFSKTPKSGAQTSIYCASEPTLEKSKDVYFQLVKIVLNRNAQKNESDRIPRDEFSNGYRIG